MVGAESAVEPLDDPDALEPNCEPVLPDDEPEALVEAVALAPVAFPDPVDAPVDDEAEALADSEPVETLVEPDVPLELLSVEPDAELPPVAVTVEIEPAAALEADDEEPALPVATESFSKHAPSGMESSQNAPAGQSAFDLQGLGLSAQPIANSEQAVTRPSTRRE